MRTVDGVCQNHHCFQRNSPLQTNLHTTEITVLFHEQSFPLFTRRSFKQITGCSFTVSLASSIVCNRKGRVRLIRVMLNTVFSEASEMKHPMGRRLCKNYLVRIEK